MHISGGYFVAYQWRSPDGAARHGDEGSQAEAGPEQTCLPREGPGSGGGYVAAPSSTDTVSLSCAAQGRCTRSKG